MMQAEENLDLNNTDLRVPEVTRSSNNEFKSVVYGLTWFVEKDPPHPPFFFFLPLSEGSVKKTRRAKYFMISCHKTPSHS